MKVLINDANERFRRSQALNSSTGLEVAGFDKVVSFSPRDIDRGFYEANQAILREGTTGMISRCSACSPRSMD